MQCHDQFSGSILFFLSSFFFFACRIIQPAAAPVFFPVPAPVEFKPKSKSLWPVNIQERVIHAAMHSATAVCQSAVEYMCIAGTPCSSRPHQLDQPVSQECICSVSNIKSSVRSRTEKKPGEKFDDRRLEEPSCPSLAPLALSERVPLIVSCVEMKPRPASRIMESINQ